VPSSKTNEAYFADYDGLQHAKHQLLAHYLDGWYAILGRHHRRIVFVDTHAGRGVHETGHEGSPLVALRRLLDHTHRGRILQNTEVRFFYLERDRENCQQLRSAIKHLPPLPPSIKVTVVAGDYEEELPRILNALDKRGKSLAPTFAFVDPFGYDLSNELLRRLMRYRGCELLISFMWRFIDLALTNPASEQLGPRLDRLFGTNQWRSLRGTSDSHQRMADALGLFEQQLGCSLMRFAMCGKNGAIKYVLLHATRHPKGRELMKDAAWKVAPDGSFSASEAASPYQPVLLVPKPDLSPLRAALLEEFRGRRVRTKDIKSWVGETLWRQPHATAVLRELWKEGILISVCGESRFTWTARGLFEIKQVPDK